MKRLAVIDLGTNTFNLLVIDRKKNSFTEIYGTKVGVGLGLGGINENLIREDAMRRGLRTLRKYKSKCNMLNVDKIVAFGTSAIRNASNQSEFINQVKYQTGIDVQVISGETEAALIYKGVNSGLQMPDPFLIMDIGGGSTEFIVGNSDKMIEAASFEIGAARIFQEFELSDPIISSDCEKVENYLNRGVGRFFDGMKVDRLIGASGSFETFYELISNKTYPVNQYVELSKGALMYQLDSIIRSSLAEREQDDRIIPIRKKMAPIAAMKIRWIIRKLNIQKIMISPYSLKEGVIDEVIV